MAENLWLVVRWMAEVAVTGNIDNSYLLKMPDEVWDFFAKVGADIVQLFS